jgi:hypothetical protein
MPRTTTPVAPITATIIDPSGMVTEATPAHAHGKWAFSDFQSLVGGYVEVVRLPGGKVALVNEEGLLQGLAPNPTASAVLGIPVVGTVVVVPAKALR